MRKIKFRGKRKDNGEWLFGYLMLTDKKAYIYPFQHLEFLPEDCFVGFVEVIPETIGQYLCTNNKGVEIYEGDDVIFSVDGKQTHRCIMNIEDYGAMCQDWMRPEEYFDMEVVKSH